MNDPENDLDTTQQDTTPSDTTQKSSTAEKVSEQSKKKVQEKISGAAKKNVAKQSLMKAIAHILMPLFGILVALIIIIGIIMFLVTMPGMVIEQIKALGKAIADGLSSWFGADTTENVEEESIYASLEYLEQMGYDLKGYGFLTDYVEDESDLTSDEKDKEIASYENGVAKDENDSIVVARSDFITAYLISDNYVYTLANHNLVTGGNGGWLDWLGSKINALWQHLKNFFGGSFGSHWTNGLLYLWEEGSGGIGYRGAFYSDTGFLNFDNVDIDAEAKTLSIKRSAVGNSNQYMTYSLDGWTGRYGMPIEFLLSVHLATMMPDLAYDMASTFDTKINLILHEVDNADVIAAYYTGSQYVTYEQIEDICIDIFSWGVNAKEAYEVMKTYGIDSPDNCTGLEEFGKEEVENESNKSFVMQGSENPESGAIDFVNSYIDKAKEYGCTDEIINANEFESFDDLISKLEDKSSELQDSRYVIYSGNTMEEEYKGTGTVSFSWNNEENNRTYSLEMSLEHQDYHVSAQGVNEDIRIIRVVSYVIYEFWNDEEVAAYCEEQGVEDASQLKCSNSNEEIGVGECCSVCREYIKQIYKALKSPNDTNFNYYIPYIENVIDHWYRDVYFTETAYDSDNNPTGKTLSFVDYDYEYEAMMKERWTLYETDDNGEYKLYAINSDGDYATSTDEIENYDSSKFEKEGSYYIFKGTQDDATTANVKVAKKAETISTSDSDNLSDLGWTDDYGMWTAYGEDGSTLATGWEQLYPEDDDEIKSKIYTRIKSTGNIVQTGEGQRAETNSEIKKMFLTNTYFRYDGSVETAEIITKLRNENDIEYGALSDDVLEDYVEIDGETYTVADYSGQVSLNQDSLNAFSMLENEHTLDADYIYRDFKELIVELGYFTKEELTDETPQLLEFPVPDIGSSGYPERSIDKRENEFGTMIHSKGDIDANEKTTLYYMLQDIVEDEDPELKSSNNSLETKTVSTDSISAINNQVISQRTNIGFDIINKVGNVTDDGEKNFSEVSVEEFLEKAKEIMDYMMENNFRYYSHPGGGGISSLKSTWQEGMNAKNVCCATYVSWVLEEVGVMSGHTNSCEGFFPWITEIDGVEIISSFEDLQEGDILFYSDSGESWVTEANGTTGGAHVDIFYGWEDSPGGSFYIYSAGKCTGSPCTKPCSGGGEDLYSSWTGGSHSTYFAIRLPFSGTKTSAEAYEGYEGNEAVVSPVTGILLEYGTYETEVDSVTGEEYRVNVDLKYGPSNILGTDDESGDQTDEPSTTIDDYETRIVSDKVGYAKILVLDKENYEKLESSTSNNWRTENSGEGLLTTNGVYKDMVSTEDEIDGLSVLDETIYGYKEFAEMYEKYGIAGYVVYIDGFKCELPDEDFNTDGNTDDIAKPSGTSLKMTDFAIAEGNLEDENELIQTKYEKDEDYKLASQSATDKLNAESMIKADAAPAISVDNLIFIKEGTVIGRTYTDREIVEDLRNENYEDYRKSTSSDENDTSEDQLIGNYLRIIMRDLDDTVVEDVENYMKLDDGTASKSGIYGDLEAIDENSTDAEKVRAAMSYFIEQGFTPEAAAGILGNLIQESGLDPKAQSSSGYRGLAQWSSSWWPEQVSWMASEGYNEDSFAGQIRSIYESSNTGQINLGGGYDAMKSLTNIDQATEFFIVYYEGCVGGSDSMQYYGVGNTYQEAGLRKRYAQNAYDIYMGDDSKGIKD